MTSIILGANVTTLASYAFASCSDLNTIILGPKITGISNDVFELCPNLRNVIFQGNAPGVDPNAFAQTQPATVYYFSGTTGWGSTLDGLPVVLWNGLMIQLADSTFGLQANQFGFNMIGSSNLVAVVEATTNLTDWTPVSTNTLSGNISFYTDPQWTNYSTRFYRIRLP